MEKKIFISYSHQQAEWVRDRLVPCLRAGRVDVLIDEGLLKAGKELTGQLDILQDQAELCILVLSPQYFESDYCRHEMERAISRDPSFAAGAVIPLMRLECRLPDVLKAAFHINLSDDCRVDQCKLLLMSCGADLGVAAPSWIAARDQLRRHLLRNESVNLVVSGTNVNWRGLVEHIKRDCLPDLALVDLQRSSTVSRRGLVREILKSCGDLTPVPPEPDDLEMLDQALSGKQLLRLAITHFDMVLYRDGYGVDFFACLRYLTMESKRLVLLVQSRAPFSSLLPHDHPLSAIDLKTVELKE